MEGLAAEDEISLDEKLEGYMAEKKEEKRP